MKVKITFSFFALLTSVASVFGQAVNNNAVKITVKPQQVYIEHGRSQQFLNFDFLLENSTGSKLKIDSIRVSVFDDKNNSVTRKIIDNHGLSPSIFTIPKIDIKAKGSLYLFNPFYAFDDSVNAKTLKYEFLFSSETIQERYKSEITVTPIFYQTKTNLIVPLRGRVLVEGGHDFYAPHRRIDLTNPIAIQVGLKANSARYANDFTIGNKKGELHKENGNNLEDWFAYGASVYASGSGKIVTLVDEIPDNKFENGNVLFSDALSLEKPSGIFGNYIVIDHGNGEYSLFAHLERGSFKVKVGATIKRGQQIALIGFSGNTDFVHTHYQLQNNSSPSSAEGLPAYFNNFNRILGAKIIKVKKGQVDSGSVIESK